MSIDFYNHNQPYHLWTYQAICYYGLQTTYAYANGVAYTTSNNVKADYVGNTGNITGGSLVEFNMFNTNDLFYSLDYSKVYILDYGYNNGSLYNSFCIYNDFIAIFSGGYLSWKAASSNGINLVAVDNSDINATISSQAVYKSGTRYPPETPWDEGRPVYGKGTTRPDNSVVITDYYHWYEVENEDGSTDIVLRLSEDGADVDPSSAIPIQTIDSDVKTTASDKNLKTGSLKNSISNTIPDAKATPISLLKGLTDSMDGGFKVIRNTTENGADSSDVITTLEACQ